MADTSKRTVRSTRSTSTKRSTSSRSGSKRTTKSTSKPNRPATPKADTSPVGKYHSAVGDVVESARKVEALTDQLHAATLDCNRKLTEAVGRYNELSGGPSKTGVGKQVRRFLATRLGRLVGAHPDRAVTSLSAALGDALAVNDADEALLRKRNRGA